MITLLNESLFHTTTEKREGISGKPDYCRTIITSSIKSVNKNNPEEKAEKTIEHVLHTTEENFNEKNTRIIVDWKTGKPFVKISQLDKNRYDTPVYLIAIPYNGFIVPVNKTHMCRIYKAVNVKSDKRDIIFEDEAYNKVAYLTVVPNISILKANEELTDESAKSPVELVVECYNIEGKDDEKRTVKTTWTIRFYLDETLTFISSIQVNTEPVDYEEYKGKKTFPIYTGKLRQTSDDHNKKNTKKEYNRSNQKRPKRTPYNEDREKGIMGVTNYSGSHFGTPVVTKSLDEMIDDMNNEKKYNKRKNKRNSKKRRNN